MSDFWGDSYWNKQDMFDKTEKDDIDFSDDTFKEINDLNKNGKYSTSAKSNNYKNLAKYTTGDFTPSGDMGYDIGQMIGRRYYSPRAMAKRKQFGQNLSANIKKTGQNIVKNWKSLGPGLKEAGQNIGDDLKATGGAIKDWATDPKRFKTPQWMKEYGSSVGEGLGEVGKGFKSAKDYLGYAGNLVKGRQERRKFNKAHEQRIQGLRDENQQLEDERLNELRTAEDEYTQYKKDEFNKESQGYYKGSFDEWNASQEPALQNQDDWKIANPSQFDLENSYRHGGVVSNSQAILQEFNKIFGRK